VIIGPGIGTFKETQSLVLKLIRTLEIPIILDADGLTALATQPKTLPLKNRSLILTPHPGEMARLIRSTVKEVLEDRIGLSKNFSQTQHVHLILKGTSHPDHYPQRRGFYQSNRQSRNGLRRDRGCPHRNDRWIGLPGI